MYHFVAFVWNPLDAIAANSADEMMAHFRRSVELWNVLLSVDGMTIFHSVPSDSSLRVYHLVGHNGVIVGRLFPTDPSKWSPSRTSSFSEAESKEIVRTGGRLLLDRYWGKYVAFLHAPGSGDYDVLRDPSGMLPCYHMAHEGVHVLFSDIEDLSAVRLASFRINRHYLAAFIHSSQMQIRGCALDGVTEVLAGECVQIRDRAARAVVVWNPADIARRPPIDDPQVAMGQLRATTQFCIDAWASAYESVVHCLSGGLDSAIVLGCWRRSPQRPACTCINRFSEAVGEDERQYARLAAHQADTELLEYPWFAHERPFDDRLLSLPRTPKPFNGAVLGELDAEFRDEVARSHSAQTVWTGQGGDHIFGNVHTPIVAADYLAQRGFDLGFPAAIRDAARLSNEPYWSVLRSAWNIGRSRTPWHPEAALHRSVHFVSVDALPEHVGDFVSHPWMKSAADLPSGKQLYLYLLSEVLHRHRPIQPRRYVCEHHPLLSQPLMELALRIPMWMLVWGGRQRGLAREAFKDCVPAAILARETKGSTGLSLTKRVRQSSSFVRELLLDGLLASHGIIDRESLMPYIAHGRNLRGEHLLPLFACIAAEIWARRWTTSQLRVAA